MKTFATVDIGSNAIRVQISNLLQQDGTYEFKTVEYMRIPIRLGEDVFSTGYIGKEKAHKLVLLGQSLMHLFEIYDVSNYLACATSAMREAKNNTEVVGEVADKTGFNIKIINGKQEAEYTHYGMSKYLGEGTWFHIDVGGGSSEINVYKDKKKVASQSFKIGAVRILLHEDVSKINEKMTDWVKSHLGEDAKNVQSIGTGGNIRKIHEMADMPKNAPISKEKIIEVVNYIDGYSLQDRINVLKLNPDRADVIIPSSNIYLSVMEASGARTMFAPKVGLSDGMLELMARGH